MTDTVQKEMSKREMLKQPYPQNMLMTILKNSTVELPELTEDVLAGIDFALFLLNEKERDVLRLRYEDRKTYTEIAEIYHVTSSAIHNREYHAFRKLRKRQVLGYILYGKDGYIRKQAESVSKKTVEYDKTLIHLTIEELDLTIRSCNTLRRAGYDEVGDIIDLTTEQIIAIKYMTKKGQSEIALKLHSLGFQDTCWKEYLHFRTLD